MGEMMLNETTGKVPNLKDKRKEMIEEAIEELAEDYKRVVKATAERDKIDADLADPKKELEAKIDAITKASENEIRIATEAFREEHEDAIAERDRIDANLGLMTDGLKNSAVEIYDATGEKSFLKNRISVQVKQSHEYDDAEAIEWIVEHSHLELLNLKRRELNKLITNAVLEMPFVERGTKVVPALKLS